MALNIERVGYSYPTFTYTVSREKVREFALATGYEDSRCIADAEEVPDVDVPVPPTFPACFTVVREGAIHDDPELGAHWNLVHSSQEYVYKRPLRVGDTLRCTPWIVDITPRSRMELLTLQVDCDDLDGQRVLESRGVIIFFADADGGTEGES